MWTAGVSNIDIETQRMLISSNKALKWKKNMVKVLQTFQALLWTQYEKNVPYNSHWSYAYANSSLR